ncbi:MAG: site-2 protease family protein, partial [Candidatus Cloacimonetes bacterium]|nr:site-2 protease family protein [Candidatus Cloacimonadota bacterium]
VTISRRMAKFGVSALIVLFASINIFLMVFNLLPFPLLDGGAILFSFIEGFSGKPVPYSIQAHLQRIAFILLLTLMAFTLFSDFSKIFNRNRAISHQTQKTELLNQ